MDCNVTEKYFMKYMDKEISEDEAKELKIHLDNCPKCMSEFKIYKSIMDDFEELELVEASHDFEVKVMERINQLEPISKKVKNNLENVLWYVFGSVSVLFGVAFLLNMNKDAVLSFVSGNSFLSSVANFIRPFSDYVSNIFIGIADSLKSGIFAGSDIFNVIKILVVITLLLAAVGIYLFNRKPKENKTEKND